MRRYAASGFLRHHLSTIIAPLCGFWIFLQFLFYHNLTATRFDNSLIIILPKWCRNAAFD